MRIIGGSLKGRNIAAPKGGQTRPVTDYIREAIFDIMGDVSGLVVLDCYAGSGSFGIEALSRGVASVGAIEKSLIAAKSIRKNIEALGLADDYRLYQQSVSFWAKTHRKKYGGFDLIFVDQPFTDMRLAVFGLLAPYLKPAGTLIARFSKHVRISHIDDLQLADQRQYGDSIVAFYHRATDNL